MNCNSTMFIVLNLEKGFLSRKMKKSDPVLSAVVYKLMFCKKWMLMNKLK